MRRAVAIIGGLIFGLFLGYLIADFNGPPQEVINGLGVGLGVGLMVAAAIRPQPRKSDSGRSADIAEV